MQHEILVSVLMTAYNREKYIAEAIESVLRSTYSNFELIIVDDCSKDNTVSIAKSYELRDKRIKIYINEKNLGDYPNRNRAASYSKGKYIKYLDSDDLIYSHGLEVMVKAMEMFPAAGIGFPNFRYDHSLCLPYLVTNAEAYREHFLKGGFLYTGPSGAIYRTDFFNKIGMFDTKYDVATDYSFNLKAAFKDSVVVFQRDLFWWRPHGGQEINLKRDLYEALNYKINLFFLSHPDCPLTINESQIALKNVKNFVSRKILLDAKKFDFQKAMVKYKIYKISPTEMFLSLLPSIWRRKIQRL